MTYDTVPVKNMWMVEKFLPAECPKCRKYFLNNGDDYVFVMAKQDAEAVKKYDIILCLYCKNYTARVMIESYRLSNLKKAEELLQKGFVNLKEVGAWGDVEDKHVIY